MIETHLIENRFLPALQANLWTFRIPAIWIVKVAMKKLSATPFRTIIENHFANADLYLFNASRFVSLNKKLPESLIVSQDKISFCPRL